MLQNTHGNIDMKNRINYPPLLIISFTDINLSIEKQFKLYNNQIYRIIGLYTMARVILYHNVYL